MNIRIFFLITLVAAILSSTMSCDKHHAKKLAGTYACKVDYHYWDMMPTHFDTTYFEDVEVEQGGRNVIVFGISIDIDSLWKGKEYSQGYIHSYMNVLFRNNSVYITTSSGGLGGNSSSKYAGVKL